MRYRKHIRLKGYDYSTPNYYFVTVCTKNRQKLFHPQVSQKYGELLPKEITNVAAASYAAKNSEILTTLFNDLVHKYYMNLEIDFYCIMHDHIHMIFAFHDHIKRKGAMGSRSYNLSDIVRVFKSLASRDIGRSIWQPNFYEHIIRSNTSLDRIRHYILYNPLVQYQEIPWKHIDPNM